MEHPVHEARFKVAHPYLTLMGLFLGGFAGMLSETSLNIALPQLSSAFNVETSIVQWMVIGYMLSIGLILPFASLFMKWFSVRKLSFFALGSFFIGCLISAFATNFAILLAGRIVQGVGTGLILPILFAVILEVFPPNKIGAAMGTSSLIVMFAPAIGPTVSGLLMGFFSWRAVFIMFALVLLVSLVFTAKYMVNPYQLTKPHVDIFSGVLSCLGFGGLVLGSGLASALGWLNLIVLGSLIVGVISLVVYVRRQQTMEQPMLSMDVFKNYDFRVGVVLVMLNFGITLSSMFLLPQYVQSGLLLPVATAGLLMLPGGIINCLISTASGRLYDRFGARIPARVGFCFSIFGTALFLMATTETSIAYVIASHIVLMIGVPLAMSPCQSTTLNSLPNELGADGSTMLNTLQQVWGAMVTAISTSLLGAGQEAFVMAGGASGATAFVAGVHWGFVFTLIMAGCALLLSLKLRKLKR